MKTIELKDLDSKETLYHFTERKNISQIEELGLIPMIGKNAKGTFRYNINKAPNNIEPNKAFKGFQKQKITRATAIHPSPDSAE